MKILLITSFMQGMGKTTLTYLLAWALTQLGKKVLVGDYDDKNDGDTVFDYCQDETGRGFKCKRYADITKEDLEGIDVFLIDLPYAPDTELLSELDEKVHGALIPLTIEHKSFNNGAKPAIKALNGCSKKFVLQHIADPNVIGRYEDIDCYSRALDIPVIHEMPKLQAANKIVSKGMAPQFSHDTTGITDLRASAMDIGNKVNGWLASL